MTELGAFARAFLNNVVPVGPPAQVYVASNPDGQWRHIGYGDAASAAFEVVDETHIWNEDVAARYREALSGALIYMADDDRGLVWREP